MWSGNETTPVFASCIQYMKPLLLYVGETYGRMIKGYSLVPRPFPPPVFDRLQYKNGGEGLEESRA